tara:strand:+ start:575 stop:1180 length:606 start_codon:yes stop_codon:yes gene_type:complete
MKNLILILITLLCINIQGQRSTNFHWPYSMVKIKHCTSDVRPSATNNKQFFWDITDMGSDPKSILIEHGFLKVDEVDSNIIRDIRMYDESNIEIERYIGFEDDLYVIYVDCSRRVLNKYGEFRNPDYIEFWKSFSTNRLGANLRAVFGGMQRNYRKFYCTEENGEYITYLIVPYGHIICETYGKGRRQLIRNEKRQTKKRT